MTERINKTSDLSVGDKVRFYDNGRDGYPRKWVNGTVIEVLEKTFLVQWEDMFYETEYEWQGVKIKGNQIIEQ